MIQKGHTIKTINSNFMYLLCVGIFRIPFPRISVGSLWCILDCFEIIYIMRSTSFSLFFHPDGFLIYGSELLTPGTSSSLSFHWHRRTCVLGGGRWFGCLFPSLGCRTLALPVTTRRQSTYLLCSYFPSVPANGSGVPSAAQICLPKVTL